MKSLSLSSPGSLDAFLKILIVAIRVQQESEPVDAEVLSAVRMWNASAQRFLSEFGISKPSFTKVVQSISKKPSDANFEPLADFVEDLKANFLNDVVADTDVRRERLALLKDICLVVIKGSEPAHARLVKNLSVFADPSLNKAFISDAGSFDQRSHRNSLAAFAKKYFKKPLNEITVDDHNALREKNKEVYSEYLKLRRNIQQVRKDAVRDFVRASGKSLVKLQEIVRFLKEQDIEHNIPVFNGYIDDVGALYNENQVKLNGNVTGTIELNPSYDADTDNTYIFNHYPAFGNGQPQRIYTVNYKQRKTEEKFDKVDKLTDKIEILRKKWMTILRTEDIDDYNVLNALVVELIYQTSGRIGSKAGASGLSAFTVKEFSDRASNYFVISYVGKKGIDQKHKILTNTRDTMLLKKLLQKLCVGKKPRDYVITTSKGKMVTSGSVTKFLASIGAPAGATVHKFRHVKGTKIAKDIMDKSPFNGKKNVKESEVNKWFMEAMKRVGAELGHVSGDKVTATTALVNYIDPRAVEDWYRTIGVRPNSTIQNILDKMKKDTGA